MCPPLADSGFSDTGQIKVNTTTDEVAHYIYLIFTNLSNNPYITLIVQKSHYLKKSEVFDQIFWLFLCEWPVSYKTELRAGLIFDNSSKINLEIGLMC